MNREYKLPTLDEQKSMRWPKVCCHCNSNNIDGFVTDYYEYYGVNAVDWHCFDCGELIVTTKAYLEPEREG